MGYDAASIEAQKDIFAASGDATKQEYAAVMKPEENYRDYILGLGIYADAPKKTAEWAEKITGILTAEIKQIAIDLQNAQAPYIVVGAGVNRQANGEQSMRALYMLSVLTGKLGTLGASNGELPSMSGMYRAGIPAGSNPVKEKISFFCLVRSDSSRRNHDSS